MTGTCVRRPSTLFLWHSSRFGRKNVDPEPLMRYCLKDVLLRSLHYVSKSTGSTLTPVSSSSVATVHVDPAGTHNVSLSTSNTRGVTTNLSVVTGLLSTLCRGSSQVTHDLLRSDLPEALESALCGGDERCVLDTMRFLDLLIVLLFEGQCLTVVSSRERDNTNALLFRPTSASSFSWNDSHTDRTDHYHHDDDYNDSKF